jgi:hypothetical protein
MSRRQAEEIQQIRVLSEQIRVLSELEELFGGDDGWFWRSSGYP